MNTITTHMGIKEWLWLGSLSLLWGGSFFFIGVVVNEVPTLVIVFSRVALAGLTLWVLVWFLRIPMPKFAGLWLSFFVMGLLNNVIPFSLIVWGQAYISTGLASILNATTPLFTVIVASLLLADEKMTANKLLGVCIGFLGTIIMVGPTTLNGLMSDVYAQLAIMGAAISYAFAGVFGRHFRKFQLHSMVLAAGQLTASALILLPIVLWLHAPSQFVMPSLYGTLSLVSLSFFSTALAYILYFRILASSGASNLALVTFLIPLSAILLGVFVLHETLSRLHIFGMLIIFLGLLVIDGRLFKRLSVFQ